VIATLIDSKLACALDAVPSALPTKGFLWLDVYAGDGRNWVPFVQRLTGEAPLEEHLRDAENYHHPSYYDSTRRYEMIVFRGLAMRASVIPSDSVLKQTPVKVKTRPTTFFVFPHLLVTIRPSDSKMFPLVRDRLLGAHIETYRLPDSPEELMLKLVNGMVDRYLELRQSLTEQAEQWQRLLLDPRKPFHNWNFLLDARQEAHKLQSLCEEQLDAMQEWRDERLERRPRKVVSTTDNPNGAVEEPTRLSDLLEVRVNDITEHIKRVHSHGERLERTLESAVQLHFSATSHRTNNIMRTLTALTAIFLPLNLITGIFGMNFESMPLLKNTDGFWLALGGMGIVALLFLLTFSTKRYLSSRIG
jgi:magnesium transporter